jgi:hypothetical protein
MIALILTLVVAQTPKAAFAVSDIAFKSDAQVCAVVGPKLPGWKHTPGITFNNPGFDFIFVDKFGPDMTRITLRPKWIAAYSVALKKFGIDATHATIKKVTSPQTAIPLTRNHLEIDGAKGVPVNPKTRQPMKLTYVETALVNKDRTRGLRPQILAATGDAKIKLIRKCYDWVSQIELSQ